MTDLPYTYTDFDGDQMIVSPSWITIHDAGVHAPSGDDAVALARAILAAAGNTGHEVVSEHQMEWRLRNAGTNCARSMRERALEEIQPRWDLHPDTQHETKRVIRALPLIPDGDTEVRPVSAYRDPDMWARLKSEIPRIYGRERVEDLPHDSEYATALHDVLTAMKRIEHGSPLLADVDDPEPQDEVPRDTELIQQVRALVKRYGAPWVAYEAARQARH